MKLSFAKEIYKDLINVNFFLIIKKTKDLNVTFSDFGPFLYLIFQISKHYSFENLLGLGRKRLRTIFNVKKI